MISNKIFALTDFVIVIVDIRALKYTILNSLNVSVLSGEARTVQECQRKARKEVVRMGARFFDEIRERKEK